jgi:hypothetical protein
MLFGLWVTHLINGFLMLSWLLMLKRFASLCEMCALVHMDMR